MPNRRTLALEVTRVERRMLRRMTSRPEQPGATDGPLRIDEVQDLRSDDGSFAVQAVVEVTGGEADPWTALEEALRQRMAAAEPATSPAAAGRTGER